MSERRRPIVVDLYAGAGGLGLGFEQAGFDVAVAVESDPVHAAVHGWNFPYCETVCTDIATLDASDLRGRTRLGDREIDVVVGGPPCQGFSLMGGRDVGDARNGGVGDFVRLVTGLRPRAFVMENVRGAVVGDHVAIVEAAVGDLVAAGYEVRLPWRILDAVDHGVPQSRERLVLMGARRGERLPDYPEPTTARAGSSAHMWLPPGPTCSDALDDLPDAEGFAALRDGDVVRGGPVRDPSPYARTLAADAVVGFSYPRAVDPTVMTASARTDHGSASRDRFAATPHGTVERVSRFHRLHPDGVAPTLRAGTDAARGAHTAPRPIHHVHPRCVTVREMARLSGFPDWFRPHSTVWHGAREIGNAVPPPLARAVAREVVSALGLDVGPADTVLTMPAPDPLHRNASASARAIGIEAPVARRVRPVPSRPPTAVFPTEGVPTLV